LAIRIRSTGLGPAKLTEYKWIIAGKEIKIRERADYIEVMNLLALGEVDWEFYVPEIGTFFAPEYSRFFLTFPGTANQEKHLAISQALHG
jgi:hypothetical protein